MNIWSDFPKQETLSGPRCRDRYSWTAPALDRWVVVVMMVMVVTVMVVQVMMMVVHFDFVVCLKVRRYQCCLVVNNKMDGGENNVDEM